MLNNNYDGFKDLVVKYLHLIISLLFFVFFFVIFGDYNNACYVIKMGYYKLFAISVAIFSLLAYINDYINNKAKEFADKSEYYYGVNVSEDSFYNRIEFKLFLNARLELFLTILVIIPGLFILSKFSYNSWVFISLFNLVDFSYRIMLSAWCSIFSLIFIYLVIILNGIFAESRKSFYDGYKIDTDKLITDERKSLVDKTITDEYMKRLTLLIEECKYKEPGYFKWKASLLTKDVLAMADSLSKDEVEFFGYILNSYLKTSEIIEELMEYDAKKGTGLVMIRDYFLGKWELYVVMMFRKYTSSFFFIAMMDLSMIRDVFKSSMDSDLYKSIFMTGGKIGVYPDSYEVENSVVCEIVEVLGLKILSPDYTDYDIFIEDYCGLSSKLFELKTDKVISNNDFKIFMNYMHECLCRFTLVNEPSLSYILDDLEELYKMNEDHQVFIDSLEDMKEYIKNMDDDLFW